MAQHTADAGVPLGVAGRRLLARTLTPLLDHHEEVQPMLSAPVSAAALQAAGVVREPQLQHPTYELLLCSQLQQTYYESGRSHVQLNGQSATAGADEYGTVACKVAVSGMVVQEGATPESVKSELKALYQPCGWTIVDIWVMLEQGTKKVKSPLTGTLTLATPGQAAQMASFSREHPVVSILLPGPAGQRVVGQGHMAAKLYVPRGPASQRSMRQLLVQSKALEAGDARLTIYRLAGSLASAWRADPDNHALAGLAVAFEVQFARRSRDDSALVELTQPGGVRALLEVGWIEVEDVRYHFAPALSEGALKRDIDAHAALLGPVERRLGNVAINKYLRDLQHKRSVALHTLPSGDLFDWVAGGAAGAGFGRIKVCPSTADDQERLLQAGRQRRLVLGSAVLDVSSARESTLGFFKQTDDARVVAHARAENISYRQAAMERAAATSAAAAAAAHGPGAGANGVMAAAMQQLASDVKALKGDTGQLLQLGTRAVKAAEDSTAVVGKMLAGQQQLQAGQRRQEEKLDGLAAGQQRIEAGMQEVAAGVGEVGEAVAVMLPEVTAARKAAEDTLALTGQMQGGLSKLRQVMQQRAQQAQQAQQARKPAGPSSNEPPPKARRRTPGVGGSGGGNLSSQLDAAAAADASDTDMASPAKDGGQEVVQDENAPTNDAAA